jgi:hypothetical protein
VSRRVGAVALRAAPGNPEEGEWGAGSPAMAKQWAVHQQGGAKEAPHTDGRQHAVHARAEEEASIRSSRVLGFEGSLGHSPSRWFARPHHWQLCDGG